MLSGSSISVSKPGGYVNVTVKDVRIKQGNIKYSSSFYIKTIKVIIME